MKDRRSAGRSHSEFLVIVVFVAICPTACALRYEEDVGFDLQENSGKRDCEAVRSLCKEVEDNGSVSDDTLQSEGMDLLRASRNDFKIACREQLLQCDQVDGDAATAHSTTGPKAVPGLAKIAEETREANRFRAEADLLAAHAAAKVLGQAAVTQKEGKEKDTKHAENRQSEKAETTNRQRSRLRHRKKESSRYKSSDDADGRSNAKTHAPELISKTATSTEVKQRGETQKAEELISKTATSTEVKQRDETQKAEVKQRDETQKAEEKEMEGFTEKDEVKHRHDEAATLMKALVRLRQLDKQRRKGERRHSRKGRKANKKRKEHGTLSGPDVSKSTAVAKMTTTASSAEKSAAATATQMSASTFSTTGSTHVGDAGVKVDRALSEHEPSVKADPKATAMLERKGNGVSLDSSSHYSSQALLADFTIEQEEGLAAKAAEREVERAAQRAAEAVRVAAALAIVHTEKRLDKLQDREARVAAAAKRGAAAALSIADTAVTLSNSPLSPHALLEEEESRSEDQSAQPPRETASSLVDNSTGESSAATRAVDVAVPVAVQANSFVGLTVEPPTSMAMAPASFQQVSGSAMHSDSLSSAVATSVSPPVSSFVDTEAIAVTKQPLNAGSTSLWTAPSVYLQADAFAAPNEFVGSAFAPTAARPVIADPTSSQFAFSEAPQFALQQTGWAESVPANILRGHAKKIRLLVANKLDGEDDDDVVSPSTPRHAGR